MATIDPDEAQLSKLAKKVLAMPPKKREDSKLGKAKAKAGASPKNRGQTEKRKI